MFGQKKEKGKEGDGQKKPKKLRAAAAVAGTGARAKRVKPVAPSQKSKLCIVLVGVVVFVAAIVALTLVTRKKDDFEISSEQFDGDIQVQSDSDGMVKWSNDYSNMNSEKSKKLIENFKNKLKGALEDEGVSVDKVEVTSLSKAPPVSFTRKEQVKVSPQGRSSFQDVSYTDVSFVNVKYKTFGTPEKNAATFGSANNGTWQQVGKLVKTRMASGGLQTKLNSFKPKSSFTASIKKAVAEHAYDITTVKPVARESVACSCQTTGFGKVTTEIPSVICDCYEGCATGLPRTILGGVENIFSIKTPICPAARYAELINDDGGYVEVVFSGYQTVKNGPDKKLPGFKMGPNDIYMHSVTLKPLGSVIKATLPPTTADPKIGGFFRVETTTPNPYVKHDPGRKYVAAVANPPISMSIHVKQSGGANLDYNSLINFASADSQQQQEAVTKIQKVMMDLRKELQSGISSLPINFLKVEVVNFDPPPDHDPVGLVLRASFTGSNAEAIQTVISTEDKNPGLTLLDLLTSSYKNLGVVYSARYSTEVLGGLRVKDKEKDEGSGRRFGRQSRSGLMYDSSDYMGGRMMSDVQGHSIMT